MTPDVSVIRGKETANLDKTGRKGKHKDTTDTVGNMNSESNIRELFSEKNGNENSAGGKNKQGEMFLCYLKNNCGK